jgi:hypothetical protein
MTPMMVPKPIPNDSTNASVQERKPLQGRIV